MAAKIALLLGITTFLLISWYMQTDHATAAEPRSSDPYMDIPEEPKQDDPGTCAEPRHPKNEAITQDYG